MNKVVQEDQIVYIVVVNHEEQYSIWPADRDLPLGWEQEGKTGPKDECLAYIEEVWVDMRPLSLRQQMEKTGHQPPVDTQANTAVAVNPGRDSLVERLAKGNHLLIASRVDNSIERFKESIDRGYVLIKFTETQGGTELGIRLDEQRSDLSQADFAQGQGIAHLEGTMTLNYIKVRCIADIDLAHFKGTGHLEIIE